MLTNNLPETISIDVSPEAKKVKAIIYFNYVKMWQMVFYEGAQRRQMDLMKWLMNNQQGLQSKGIISELKENGKTIQL